MASLDLKLFGEFELTGASARLPTRKAEALLAYLAVPAGRAHGREKLSSLLWGDRGDAQARHSLSQTLYLIRTSLGEDSAGSLVVDARTVSLDPSFADVDVGAFERLAAQGTSEAMGAAAALYRGDLLEGLDVRQEAFEDWLFGERRRLREVAIGVLEGLLRRQIDDGDDRMAADTARRLLAIDPLQEPVHRTLIRVLLRQGHREAALRQYRSCAEILKRDLGLEPDPETAALFREIVQERAVIGTPTGAAGQPVRSEHPTPPITDKPSIAVLPFATIGDDRGADEFLSDGMTEDLITGLSRFRSLFVISRSSSLAYKGKSADARQVARDLGVRYVLEGSVRRVGGRIRITVQLSDAETGSNIWAERFDRDLRDVFAIQDEVTEAIIGAIAPEIGEAERARAQRTPPDNLDSWGLYQRALTALSSVSSEDDLKSAIKQFDRINEVDPTFAPAFAMAAIARARYLQRFEYVRRFDADDQRRMMCEIREKADRGITLDPRDSTGLYTHGRVQSLLGRHDIAISKVEEAIANNPNDAAAHYSLGIVLHRAGRAEEALSRIDHAMRLSPRDAHLPRILTYRSVVLFDIGRYAESFEVARRASLGPTSPSGALAVAAAALAKLGRVEEARVIADDFLAQAPGMTLSLLREKLWYGSPEGLEAFLDALREAGVPE